MFGCCPKAMGVVYIDKEGEVDPAYLKANYPEGSKLVGIQDSTSIWAKGVFKSRGEFPVTTKVVDPKGCTHEICWCPCHSGDMGMMC